MKLSKKIAMLGLSLGLAASAQAADVYQDGVATGWADANGNINTSRTMTADHTYKLVGQVYVANGATLTIQAGTKIKSVPAEGGSLAITRGSKIFALGTAEKPVVFTSTLDNGTARVGDGMTLNLGVNEWGNLTIMGRGLIGAEMIQDGSGTRTYDETPDSINNPVSNTAKPTGLNKATMEGLTAGFQGDPDVIYGGNNDDDDSGTLAYVSLRYGGKVLGLGNELNGLSMGAIGRETDVHHLDIYQNVDDGIETWGGTVNYKYISIWNVGDDSFDVDQGWRGKAQFVLIVQGWGTKAGQGSGVGDNCFETDGAEASTAVPTTTATIYNVTVIGQPDGQGPGGLGFGGDTCFEFRDNARIQYRNVLAMDIGERLILEKDSEGGSTTSNPWRYGGSVPGFDNTATGVWGLAYSEAWNTGNVLTGGHANNADYLGVAGPMNSTQLQQLYASQSAGNAAIGQGKLCEVTDSLFYNLTHSQRYTVSDAVGVTSAGTSNAAKANVVQAAGTLPIVAMTRPAATLVNGSGATGLYMGNLTHLDPRRNTANAATVSVSAAPIADGFFTPAQYRGAFSDDTNWCLGWTAASDFGIYSGETNPSNPAATVIAFGTSFQTETGKSYLVESSTDGVNWSPVSVVDGDGTIKSISPVLANTLYRVTVQ